MLTMVFTSFILIIPSGGARPQSQPSKPSEVTIQIKSTKSKVVSGDPIALVVSITNKGQRDILIGRNLPGVGSDAAHVDFLISDKQGHLPEGNATDVDRFTPNPESFANAVIRNWVALPPGLPIPFQWT